MPAFFDKGFMVRVPAWHKLGTVFDDYPGREEAILAAGHDFEVIERPVLAAQKELGEEALTAMGDVVEGWKVLINSKTNAAMHIVRDSYVTVQNSVLWDLVDAIVDQPDVKYETAGVLRDGAVLWVLARLDTPLQINKDDSEFYPYIATSTTHDGTGGVKAQNTSIRIVCANTYSAASLETGRTGREFTFKHTKNIMNRVEEAKKILAGATEQAKAFQELGNELVEVPFSDKAIAAFIEEFVPMPVGEVISDRVKENIDEARAKVKNLFYGSETINDDIRNTAYGALQVGVEYLDHLRGYRNNYTYMNRTLLKPEPLKEQLVPMIRTLADKYSAKKVMTKV